ncbi:hypothetical protein RHMOL_Rhmol04G0293800 [Rhododendron molle]|uniref:Uncharacterized protein n=1 Tax=Rhododendron molle TaxID=49168 RepID=A0ACC0P833_RHOML|nr:hypothetical protein RHMOL_Rhmol04G0293800 [Rhododendron molle]
MGSLLLLWFPFAIVSWFIGAFDLFFLWRKTDVSRALIPGLVSDICRFPCRLGPLPVEISGVYALAPTVSSWFLEHPLRMILVHTLSTIMVIHAPFIRWFYKDHPSCLNSNRCDYYIITHGGDETIAAQAEHHGTDHAIYQVCHDFKRDYTNILGLAYNLTWNLESQLVEWLDALVHNSFVRYSNIGDAPGFDVGDIPYNTRASGVPIRPIDLGKVPERLVMIESFSTLAILTSSTKGRYDTNFEGHEHKWSCFHLAGPPSPEVTLTILANVYGQRHFRDVHTVLKLHNSRHYQMESVGSHALLEGMATIAFFITLDQVLETPLSIPNFLIFKPNTSGKRE